jgi:hypothetical protein
MGIGSLPDGTDYAQIIEKNFGSIIKSMYSKVKPPNSGGDKKD